MIFYYLLFFEVEVITYTYPFFLQYLSFILIWFLCVNSYQNWHKIAILYDKKDGVHRQTAPALLFIYIYIYIYIFPERQSL